MTALESLRIKKSRILDIARQYGAEDVRVFGSIARGDETAGSDVDFLVAFEAGRSLLDHVALKLALSELLDREVDVVSARGLSPHLAQKILGEAVPL